MGRRSNLGAVSRLPPFSAELRPRLADLGWIDDPRATALLDIIWTGPDPDGALQRVLDYVEAAHPVVDPLADPDLGRRLAHLSGVSRELMRQLSRHPTWLVGAEAGDLVGRVRSTLASVAGDDVAGVIDVEEGGRRLAEMADDLVATVLAEERQGEGPPMAVMAFGKWGGHELNYWSDIDLMFVFDGGAADAAVANRTAAGVMRRLGDRGPDGVVIHPDADLRPEGSRGPLARSLEAYRTYYQRWAEPWEFQALLKVRHGAGDLEVGASFLDMVEEVLWPETLNPDSLRSLRTLKARMEEGAKPGDLKRAPGGIRDIEFAVQMLQIVHGRFDPGLRRTNSLQLMAALADGGYVDREDAATLSSAYRWLRAAEHRIQLWDLRPVHVLPTEAADRERLARAMGYRGTMEQSARDAFEADLVRHRSAVRGIHEDLYFRPLLEAFAATPKTGLSREGAERRLVALGFRDVAGAVRTFEALTAGLSRRSRLMHQMLPLILDWLADSPDPDLGLDQLRLLAANMPDHAELITALHDRPEVGRRLAYLLGSSQMLGRYLDRIPEFVPRLDDDRAVTELRDRAELELRLRRRLETRPDPEERVGTLRRFARRHLLRVAARDLLGMADVDRTMHDLSAGADAAVAAACSIADAESAFAVIAMGRWGGRELSYGSDLDLLYVFDDPMDPADAQERAVALRDLLAAPARDGVAWDLDANLRPEGRSGPLVRSLASYRVYYERWAETWEFQSLVKARPVGGDAGLGSAFMELASDFVWLETFPESAIGEIRRMKARIEKQRIPPGENPDFHLKLGPGGLSDVEFLVQLLQLGHGGRLPELRVTSTLEALEGLVEVGAVSPRQAEDLAAAYRFCSHVRNRLYLQVGRRQDSLPTEPNDERRLAISLGYDRRGDLREDYRRLTRRARRIFEDVFFE